MTAFTAKTDGFHFPNTFVNRVVSTPFGNITTYGRCGGMAFAALDFFNSHRPIPDYKTADFPTGCPPDGDPLADYIYARLLDSFTCPTATQFVTWTVASDHRTWFSAGVTAWTRGNSWPFLKSEIDHGRPASLGLIRATSLDHIGDNHQIVAYGYDEGPNGLLTAHVYDDNYPDQEMTLQTGPGNPHWNESNGEIWRGWFVQSYIARTPPGNIPQKHPQAPPPPPKQLTVSVIAAPTPIPAMVPVSFTVSAVDAISAAPVSGDVRVAGMHVGPSNTPIRYVFRPRLFPFPILPNPGHLPPPLTGIWPKVTVAASGYAEVEVRMPFA